MYIDKRRVLIPVILKRITKENQGDLRESTARTPEEQLPLERKSPQKETRQRPHGFLYIRK